MARTPFINKNGMKKGTWTPEEDKKLIDYVTRYGHWNWRQLPKFAGLARCGKSCRMRWKNYLRPGIIRGNYTQEEEDIIVNLHAALGNRWSIIASHLLGRSDNEIKNHWNTHLKKRIQHTSSSSLTNEMSEASSSSHDSLLESRREIDTVEITGLFPKQYSSSDDIFCTASAVSNENLIMQDDLANFLDTKTCYWTELNLPDISYIPNEFLEPFVSQPEFLYPVYDVQLWD